MKKVVFALACLVIGSGAIAASPKAALAAEKNAAVKVAVNTGIQVGTVKQAESKFRIQKAFQMWDACGQMITVWVSAPHGTAWDTMYKVAIDHVMDCLNSNGCYE